MADNKSTSTTNRSALINEWNKSLKKVQSTFNEIHENVLKGAKEADKKKLSAELESLSASISSVNEQLSNKSENVIKDFIAVQECAAAYASKAFGFFYSGDINWRRLINTSIFYGDMPADVKSNAANESDKSNTTSVVTKDNKIELTVDMDADFTTIFCLCFKLCGAACLCILHILMKTLTRMCAETNPLILVFWTIPNFVILCTYAVAMATICVLLTIKAIGKIAANFFIKKYAFKQLIKDGGGYDEYPSDAKITCILREAEDNLSSQMESLKDEISGAISMMTSAAIDVKPDDIKLDNIDNAINIIQESSEAKKIRDSISEKNEELQANNLYVNSRLDSLSASLPILSTSLYNTFIILANRMKFHSQISTPAFISGYQFMMSGVQKSSDSYAKILSIMFTDEVDGKIPELREAVNGNNDAPKNELSKDDLTLTEEEKQIYSQVEGGEDFCKEIEKSASVVNNKNNIGVAAGMDSSKTSVMTSEDDINKMNESLATDGGIATGEIASSQRTLLLNALGNLTTDDTEVILTTDGVADDADKLSDMLKIFKSTNDKRTLPDADSQLAENKASNVKTGNENNSSSKTNDNIKKFEEKINKMQEEQDSSFKKTYASSVSNTQNYISKAFKSTEEYVDSTLSSIIREAIYDVWKGIQGVPFVEGICAMFSTEGFYFNILSKLIKQYNAIGKFIDMFRGISTNLYLDIYNGCDLTSIFEKFSAELGLNLRFKKKLQTLLDIINEIFDYIKITLALIAQCMKLLTELAAKVASLMAKLIGKVVKAIIKVLLEIAKLLVKPLTDLLDL